MSFKYINPGFSAGATFLNTNLKTVTDKRFVAGQALIINLSVRRFNFPAGTKTVYASMTLDYLDKTRLLFWSDLSSSITTGKPSWSGTENQLLLNGEAIIEIGHFGDGYHQVWMKIHSDATEGIFEFFVDGIQYFSYEGDVQHGLTLGGLTFYSNALSGSSIGNIIISDEPISKTEKICILSPTSTTATMTDNGDGSYTATAGSQTVLQKFDIEDLTTKVNGGTVTGLAVVGSPAYCGDGDLLHLAGVKGTSEQATTEIPTVEGKSALVSWSENLNPAALADAQIGWKAKA